MASLKYFLLCPFVFLCISSSFAKRVLNSNVGGPDLPLNEPVPVTSGFGPVLDVGGPKGAVGGGSSSKRGVDQIINEFGVGVGVGVGYGPGYGLGPGGFWSDPAINGPGGPNSECMLGYVCPSNDRRGCNNFSYGNCQSYGFYPLTSIDSHEVEINWATSKPVAAAHYGNSGPRQSPPQHDNFGPHQAQHGNAGPDQRTRPPSGV